MIVFKSIKLSFSLGLKYRKGKLLQQDSEVNCVLGFPTFFFAVLVAVRYMYFTEMVSVTVPAGSLTKLFSMAIEIVSIPIRNGDFP